METADFFSQERFMSGMQLSEWKLCVGRAIISAELLGGRGWLVFVGIGRQGLWGHSCQVVATGFAAAGSGMVC